MKRVFSFFEKKQTIILIITTCLFTIFSFGFFYLATSTFDGTHGNSVVNLVNLLFTYVGFGEYFSQFFCVFFGYLAFVSLLLACLISERNWRIVFLVLAFIFSALFLLSNILLLIIADFTMASFSDWSDMVIAIFWHGRYYFAALALVVSLLTTIVSVITAISISKSKTRGKTKFWYIKLPLGLAISLVVLLV